MSDERGLVGRAAITLLVLIVVGGFAVIDGASVMFSTLQLSDVADASAAAAAETYDSTHDAAQAKESAIETAHDRDKKVKLQKFEVSPQGVITVTLRRVASTLIVRRVSFLRHFGVVHASSSASP
jgi:Flp pilus assembly protein TadG